jgi:hypothetical protein
MAVQRMEQTLPWFAALTARERASVGVLAQLGVRAFVEWFADEGANTPAEEIFTSAPRDLAQSLSLEQTVELVRATIAVVEGSVAHIAGDNAMRQAQLRESLLRYSSEVAFAAANVYARLAENRGAWDARLQAMVLERILSASSDAGLEARATASGWRTHGGIIVLVGSLPASRMAAEVHAAQMQRTAASHNLDALVGVHGDHIVAVISGVDSDKVNESASLFLTHFGPGPVVAGSRVEGVNDAHHSATEALAGFRALPLAGIRERLVNAADLVPARLLSGDTAAADSVVAALASLKSDVRSTLAEYLERAASIEACARNQFVHVNTVRYRLRQVLDVTGLDPANPAENLTLRLALMQGRASGLL